MLCSNASGTRKFFFQQIMLLLFQKMRDPNLVANAFQIYRMREGIPFRGLYSFPTSHFHSNTATIYRCTVSKKNIPKNV